MFLSPEGRLSRQPFNIIIGAAFLLLFLLSSFLSFHGLVIALLIALIVTFCPVVKRLHDREYSALWYAYFLLIVILALVLMAAPLKLMCEYAQVMLYNNTAGIPVSNESGIGNVAHALAFLLVLGAITYMAVIGWFFAEVSFFRGTEGPNEYGPDPLDKFSSTCGMS
jgi:uncharacterized membrane protein YhaH (DUF805 family)